MIERILIGLLTGGHVLLEGVPGLAKTLTVRTICEAIQAKFSRIQFTPDLLPADLIGTVIYNQKSGDFTSKLGPVFANLVLADEINRAPAKVQSALLEAMQERQVTIGGTSHRLPHPFFVMATQNPVEQEGTYPLPEAQRDRFLFKLVVDYPAASEEREMMRRWGQVTKQPQLAAVSNDAELLALRSEVDAIHVADAIQDYVLALVRETRAIAVANQNGPAGGAAASSRPLLAYGASPRASIGLYQAGKALAWLRDQDHVSPPIIQEIFLDVMRHRIGLTYEAEAEGLSADAILRQVLDRTPVPGVEIVG
jgi:MoxR-like ATPase